MHRRWLAVVLAFALAVTACRGGARDEDHEPEGPDLGFPLHVGDDDDLVLLGAEERSRPDTNPAAHVTLYRDEADRDLGVGTLRGIGAQQAFLRLIEDPRVITSEAGQDLVFGYFLVGPERPILMDADEELENPRFLLSGTLEDAELVAIADAGLDEELSGEWTTAGEMDVTLLAFGTFPRLGSGCYAGYARGPRQDPVLQVAYWGGTTAIPVVHWWYGGLAQGGRLDGGQAVVVAPDNADTSLIVWSPSATVTAALVGEEMDQDDVVAAAEAIHTGVRGTRGACLEHWAER